MRGIDPAQISDGSLSWRVHPLRRDWRVSLGVTALLLLIWWAVWLWTRSKPFTFLSVIIMLGSLSSFFFPVTFSLDEEFVTVRSPFTTKRKRWVEFKSFWVDRHGVLLSPFARRSRLESFRGLYIRFSANRDEVVEFVRRRWQENGLV